MEHRSLQLSRVELHVVIDGMSAGEPVVLLHGWPETWHAWRKVMPLLAQRYRLIAPDLPGLGDSSRPAVGYDKKTIAQDLREMCERLSLPRFTSLATIGAVLRRLRSRVPRRTRSARSPFST